MLRIAPTVNLVLWFGATLGVLAQTTSVTSCIQAFEWSINDKNQTPCLVAAYLESACGKPTKIDPLPVESHYSGPNSTQQNTCLCSSVTYMMVSACGGCQGRNFQNWTTWSMDCIVPTVTTFSEEIPAVIDVPAWAFLNVTLTNDTLDPVAAQNALKGIAPPPLTSSSMTPAPTSVSASPSSTSAALSSQSTTKSHSNAGAIAGGVVGGLVFFAIVSIAILWWYMRNRQNAVQKDLMFDSRALISTSPMMSQQTGSTQSPNNGPSSMAFSTPLYGTSMSMSTFPTSPVTSAVFTTPATGSRRSMESISQSVAQFGSQQAYAAQHPPGYKGVAEI